MAARTRANGDWNASLPHRKRLQVTLGFLARPPRDQKNENLMIKPKLLERVQ
jgi:hypothetical protein